MTRQEQLAALDRALSALEVCTLALRGKSGDADNSVADVLESNCCGPLCDLREAMRDDGSPG